MSSRSPVMNRFIGALSVTTLPVSSTVTYSAAYPAGACNSLGLYVNYTKGSLTSAYLLIECSLDGTNWYPLNINGLSDTNPTHLVLPSASLAFQEVISIATAYVRIGVLGSGTATSSAITVDVQLGVV